MTKYSGYNADAENFNGNMTPQEIDGKSTPRDRFVKYWMNALTLIEASKFEYKKLPVNLPRWEIEQRLIVQGSVTGFRHPIYGICTMWGSRKGVGIYNGATGFVGAQAVLGEFEGKDGVDCVIGYNTSRDKNYISSSIVGERLIHYANILADIDLSISMIAEASRTMSTIGAKTDSAVDAVRLWFDALKRGERVVPLLETGVFEEVVPMLSKDCQDARGMAAELQGLKTAYLKEYYNWSGVAYIAKKAERMITDEVEADEDMLSINIYDQLACRAEWCARMNALFSLDIEVRVNNLVIT